MGHFAKILNGTVINIIVAEPEFFKTFQDTSPGEWIQTSYNTRSNVHHLPNSNTPSGNPAMRGNYATIGGVYDRTNDVFYRTQPYPSWILNEQRWEWEAPTPMPVDDQTYIWDEIDKSWKSI
jgi:hypothetical protein